MTLYLMHGFAKAAEFHVDVPQRPGAERLAVSGRALPQRATQPHCIKDDVRLEFLTSLNYVARRYPDASWTGGALTGDERKADPGFFASSTGGSTRPI